MRTIARVCVFCGSSSGRRPSYRHAANALGAMLARGGITVVYGGANVGLMTEVADGALAAGGQVIGVMTHHLAGFEISHTGLTEMHVVDTMAERKALLNELSDAFIALPGGLGTLEELFEMVVYAQLHLHDKPVGLLDVDGFYDSLRAFIRHSVDERLVSPENAELMIFDDVAERLLERMRRFVAQPGGKWIDQQPNRQRSPSAIGPIPVPSLTGTSWQGTTEPPDAQEVPQ